MTQTTLTLELSDELAREAAAAGLLTPEAVTRLLQSEIARRQRPSTLSRARGLLSSQGAPPLDEEVARWLEERRAERYG